MSSGLSSVLPLPLDEKVLQEIAGKAKDWALMHGAAMRSKTKFSEDSLVFAPFTLLPSPFTREEFEKAYAVQPTLNLLTHRVAYSHDFLRDTLKSTIQVDEFTRKLYEIYDKVRLEGFSQRLSVALLRSDYLPDSAHSNSIKQVEINTIASSFAGVSSQICSLHRYVLSELGHPDKVKNLPENNALAGLCKGLVQAWKMFGNPKGVVLFIVEDVTYNICDQRFMEFEVRRQSPETRVVRRTLGQLGREASLNDTRCLLLADGTVVSVVYFRAGYDPCHYEEEGAWEARLMVERSTAVKCPSIQYHLAGTKKVQQVLAKPRILDNFLHQPQQIAAVSQLFTEFYSLDQDEEGEEGLRVGLKKGDQFVLKPQREGGGNNVYGTNVVVALRGMTRREHSSWILMRRLEPRLQDNYILRPGQDTLLPQPVKVVSELGVFAVVIGDEKEVYVNEVVGHMLRTKLSHCDEGGVAAGLGALDSPYLV